MKLLLSEKSLNTTSQAPFCNLQSLLIGELKKWLQIQCIRKCKMSCVMAWKAVEFGSKLHAVIKKWSVCQITRSEWGLIRALLTIRSSKFEKEWGLGNYIPLPNVAFFHVYIIHSYIPSQVLTEEGVEWLTWLMSWMLYEVCRLIAFDQTRHIVLPHHQTERMELHLQVSYVSSKVCFEQICQNAHINAKEARLIHGKLICICINMYHSPSAFLNWTAPYNQFLLNC